MFKINVFIAVMCVSVTCLAEENTISPEREKIIHEWAIQVGIEGEKMLKESEKQKGRLLYLHANHHGLRNTCELGGEIWARLFKNNSELKEVLLLTQTCSVIDNSILSFRRKYEYAEVIAEDEKKRKIIKKMLVQDIELAKSGLALWCIAKIDIHSKDFNSAYALSLSEDIKNHCINIDDDFNNLRLYGELLSVTH